MLSHIPVGGPAALRTTVDMFAAAQGVMFFIAVQMADQAVLNSSTEPRVWKREVRGVVSALVGVAIFVVVLVGLPRLLLG